MPDKEKQTPMTFKDLGLSADLLKALEDCGYKEPTPIQAKAIPSILMMRDLVGIAQTGTGKTAGFTLPMIEILADGAKKARMPRSLILSPTRELAAQIADNFEKYGKYHKLSMALLTGGSSMPEQIKKLERGVDVLIATPGRLLDLFERGNILLSGVRTLVIDEADRMLDMGFIPDIEKIVGLLSPMRQTLLFSATMPDEIRKLTQKFLNNPVEVSVTPKTSAAETVEQFIVQTNPKQKRSELHKIVKNETIKSAFIFCNTKRMVDTLAKWMKEQGFAAEGMHGDMPQKVRNETLAAFKEGKLQYMVCSDVAARGIDVDAVSHVFNFDVPNNPEDYIHRIGRTGRAGESGLAWMLSTKQDQDSVAAIEKLIGQKIKLDNASGGKAEKQAENNKKQQKSGPKDNSKKAEHKKSGKPRKETGHKERQTRKDDGDRDSFGDDIPAFLR